VIALVDYGAGNVASVARAFAAVGARVAVTRSPRTLARARAVVIPGVGHFAATAAIGPQLRQALAACARTKPLLGICLGLQFLFDGSEESPRQRGLSLIGGRCTVLPSHAAKVPHVGWNTFESLRPSALLAGVPPATPFFFTHSYAAPVTAACVARTTYTVPFAAAIEDGFVSGVQFHPEKSGDAGLHVLRNFVSAL